MPILGLIGGIAPESTIDYYRRILSAYRAARPQGAHPQIFINSIDMYRLLALAEANQLKGLAEYMVEELSVLAKAGADVALFCSNTPHLVFDAIQKRSPLPLISIVEATCREARARGLQRVGLLGTRFTMQAGFYAEVFGRQGMAVVPPRPDEQDRLHGRYMGELIHGVLRPETRDELLALIETMRRREGLDGVALAGTELPLLLRAEAVDGLPLLDTTGIHVGAAVESLLS